MTRILQISDTHIVPYGQLAYGQVDTAQALADCVETINQSMPEIGPIDMVIIAGDWAIPADAIGCSDIILR